MKIKDLPRHLRPREKLTEKGVENLKDIELMAILLRTGNKGKNVLDLAKEILSKYPKKNLLQVSVTQLLQVKGIDVGKACTLVAAFELVRRSLELTDSTLPTINNPDEAIIHLYDIRLNKKEHFVALYLNARNQIIHKETISVGTLNASLVHPREVFEPAIRVSAAQVILAHNHPSGDPEPSDADILLTKRLAEAGRLLGIDVLDHVIVTKNKFKTLKQSIIDAG